MPSSVRTVQNAVAEALLRRENGLVHAEIVRDLSYTAPDVRPVEILNALRAMRDEGIVHGFTASYGPTLWVLRPARLVRPAECTNCAERPGQLELCGLCEDCAEPCDGCTQPVAGCICCDDYEPIDPI